MSKFSNSALALTAVLNLKKQKEISDYINNDNSEMALKAKKECTRFNIITLGIVFLVMIPIIIFTMLSILNSFDNPKYPNGATKQKLGHISLYEDVFWYTDSSQRYEFTFDEYNLDDSFKRGESIYVYLDDNDNLVYVGHISEYNKVDYGLIVSLIMMFVVPLFFILFHVFVGRKTYAKNWWLYYKWYEQEIEPYLFNSNFNVIVANKKYYDVTVNVKNLGERQQKLYKKYRNKNIIYIILLVLCIILTFYFCTKFGWDLKSWLVRGIMVIYIIFFYVLIDNCSVEMRRIKSSHYEGSYGFCCQKCGSEVNIKYEDLEKYDLLPRNESNIRIINCYNCGNPIPLYNYDSALEDYKKYLDQLK